MESVSTWIDVITNFLAGLIHGILSWLSEAWQGISTLVSSLFFWVISLVKNEIFISWIKALATPAALIWIAFFVTRRIEKDKQEQQQRLEEDKKKQQKEDKLQATLSDYLKQMTTLLLDKELFKKDHQDPTALVARALTITAIKALNSERNEQLTNFLFEANLIKDAVEKSNLPSLLQSANLIGANLEFANLLDANLIGANLTGANLTGANLEGTKVEEARFGYNKGIDEEMKADLIRRGAIFLEESTETDRN